MKLDYSCDQHKPLAKGATQTDKCFCKYLNRKYIKNLKIWDASVRSNKGWK